MSKKGVSEVIAAVLLIMVVISASLIFAYFYNDFIYRQQDAIEGTVFEELGVEGSGCKPDWVGCSEWSKCEVDYNLDYLVGEGIELQGFERRTCQDANKCAGDKVEEQKCSARELIAVEIVEKDGKEYIEIRDKNGNLVSKLDKDEKEGTLYIDLYL